MIRYQMRVIGDSGMYTYGDMATSVHLAKIAVGSLIRKGTSVLGVYRLDGGEGPVAGTLVEAETFAGQWSIGPGAAE